MSYLPFSGAKIALLWRDTLLIYQRDKSASIPFPGLWDLPGGGREGNETPSQCILRETKEEFGLLLKKEWIVWARTYPSESVENGVSWFFVAHVPDGTFEQIEFGNEGQRWEISSIAAFLQRDDAVERLKKRLQEYLDSI